LVDELKVFESRRERCGHRDRRDLGKDAEKRRGGGNLNTIGVMALKGNYLVQYPFGLSIIEQRFILFPSTGRPAIQGIISTVFMTSTARLLLKTEARLHLISSG